MTLCTRCHNEPIHVKSRCLCHPCYRRLWKSDSLPDLPASPGPTRADRIRRARTTYGPELLKALKRMGRQPGLTCKRVADAYGLSRTRVWQLYAEIMGRPYSEAVEAKHKIVQEDTGCPVDLVQRAEMARLSRTTPKLSPLDAQLLTVRVCEQLGFAVSSAGGLLQVNGHNVAVKATNRLWAPGKHETRKYYAVTIPPGEWEYLVAWIWPTATAYVIPKAYCDQHSYSVYLPSGPLKRKQKERLEDRVEAFREAWGMLGGEA